MIEQLTEQNSDLEAKIEAINDVNDQLQEAARDEERELSQSRYGWGFKMLI